MSSKNHFLKQYKYTAKATDINGEVKVAKIFSVKKLHSLNKTVAIKKQFNL